MRRFVGILVCLGLVIFVGMLIRGRGDSTPGDEPTAVNALKADATEAQVGDHETAEPDSVEEIAEDEAAPRGSPPQVASNAEFGPSEGVATPSIELAPAGEASPDPATCLSRARDRIRAGELVDAARLLTEAYRGFRGTDRETQVCRLLSPVVEDLFFSKTDFPAVCLFREVKSGNTLEGIARELERQAGITISAGMIMKTNGIKDARRIRPGMRLKIVDKPLRIEVFKELHRLEVYLGDVLVKTHAVGLGRNDSTPVGSFVVATRKVNPPWLKNGELILFGDPRNVLGTRWLGFRSTPDHVGYGIHGTWEPQSIGRDFSEGCIRMRNDEIEELFDLVPRGTEVLIHP